MNFKPHDYQSYAIDYIEQHPVAAVLLDMGLGKTVISLTAIADLLFDSFMAHRVLVVAPLRVARDTWPAEIEKWAHLKELTYTVAVGSARERRALMVSADITIINRENLSWLIESSGFSFDYDTVVIDELSSFKNHQSKRFKALLRVRPKVKRIIGLTGTPSSNGLMDLWAEFRLLDMGQRLGRFITQYRNTFFLPDKRNGQIIYSYKPMPGAEDAIYSRISDITISMKSTDHLKMPELVSTRYEVYLSDAEADRYEELKQALILQLPDGEVTAANAAALTGKLAQLANGAIYAYTGDTIEFHDRKLDALEDIIESANGKPILVAYWFRHDLQRIKKRFDVREIQQGHRRLEQRQNPGSGHPSCLCRSRHQPAGRWLHPYLVRPDVVAGALPADERTTVAAGPELRHRGDTAHHHEGHYRRTYPEGAGGQGQGTGRTHRCGQGDAGGVMPLDDSYIRLAHAIVVQAAKDYDAELDWFRQNPPLCEEDRQHQTYLNHKSELQSLERFFRSGWFELLSGLDGEALMEKIREGGIAR